MVLFPVKDTNPLLRIRFQFVTVALIGACVAVFLWQLGLGAQGERAVYRYGMIPAVLFGERQLSPELAVIPAEFTVVTSMFLHGGFMHLIGNMLYLWIFGDNVEDSMGHTRFVLFYLLSGIAGAMAHAVAAPESVVPTIGASGAISGVLGAYLVLHPRAQVLVLIFFRFPVTLPAWIVLGSWIGLQLFNAAMETGGSGGGGVAWLAHVGGFAAGAVLVIFMRKRTVPLLDDLHSAREVGRAVMEPPHRARSRIPDAGGSWRRRD